MLLNTTWWFLAPFVNIKCCSLKLVTTPFAQVIKEYCIGHFGSYLVDNDVSNKTLLNRLTVLTFYVPYRPFLGRP